MSRRRAREERILRQAEEIHARRKREARAAAFAEVGAVMIRWDVPHQAQKRLGLAFGHDGVTVPAARVAPMVRAILRRKA